MLSRVEVQIAKVIVQSSADVRQHRQCGIGLNVLYILAEVVHGLNVLLYLATRVLAHAAFGLDTRLGAVVAPSRQ